ncbi:MAG: AI-2E family transporter, partial [Pseudomonas sp.]
MPSKTQIERGGMFVLLVLVTAGFLFIVASFMGALLWATIAAIVFQP